MTLFAPFRARVSLVNSVAIQLLRALPKERISRAVGRLCEQRLPSMVSALVSRSYSMAYHVQMGEAAAPHGCYRSFDAFFTRTLREGVRPIATSKVVSPCDGQISAHGPIDEGSRLFVKGQPYDVADLVGSPGPSRDYVGGQFAVIYLSPKDYHRVHSPIDGRLLRIHATGGEYYPVNSLGERWVPQLLVQNRRVAFFMETLDGFPITLVMVGALIVGKITANALGDRDVEPGEHPLESAIQLQKGDELGAFHLGSTVVLLAAPGISLAPSDLTVRYGQPLTVEAQ